MCVFALVCLARGPKITEPDSTARERSREERDHFCIHSPTFSPHHELGLRTSVEVSFGGELFLIFFKHNICVLVPLGLSMDHITHGSHMFVGVNV